MRCLCSGPEGKKLENTDTGESRPPDFRVLLIVVKVKLEKTSAAAKQTSEHDCIVRERHRTKR